MWYTRQFDISWVTCNNFSCKSEFIYDNIKHKRKCPSCNMDNKRCIKKKSMTTQDIIVVNLPFPPDKIPVNDGRRSGKVVNLYDQPKENEQTDDPSDFPTKPAGAAE